MVLAAGEIEDVWWLEIDRGTESLPRIRTMAERYLAFAGLGVPGPLGVVPRVLVSVTSSARQRAVEALIRRLPPPAEAVFVVVAESRVAEHLVGELFGEIREPP